MERHRVLQRGPGESGRHSHPYRHPCSVAAALREAYLVLLTMKHEIRLDKIFTWLFQKPFSVACLYC